jgi:hypothetical protein
MEGAGILFFLLAGAVLFAALGYYIAAQKGRPETEGLVLGLVFGPLGCLIEAILPTIERNGQSPGSLEDAPARKDPLDRRLVEKAVGNLDEAARKDEERRARREKAREGMFGRFKDLD